MSTSMVWRCVYTLACCVACAVIIGGCSQQTPLSEAVVHADTRGASDAETARLLVDLELRTRAVIAAYYTEADEEHRAWMAQRLCLPAAVADRVFHETVPQSTGGRAWVKMVVESPRNPNNRGDENSLNLMRKIVREKRDAGELATDNAVYFGRPIVAKQTCLTCHGEPAGAPDPFFPQFTKNGWHEGDVIGAVVARVEPPRQVAAGL